MRYKNAISQVRFKKRTMVTQSNHCSTTFETAEIDDSLFVY